MYLYMYIYIVYIYIYILYSIQKEINFFSKIFRQRLDK